MIGRLLCRIGMHKVRYQSVSFPLGSRPPCAQWYECERCWRIIAAYCSFELVWKARLHRAAIDARYRMFEWIAKDLYQ